MHKVQKFDGLRNVLAGTGVTFALGFTGGGQQPTSYKDQFSFWKDGNCLGVFPGYIKALIFAKGVAAATK